MSLFLVSFDTIITGMKQQKATAQEKTTSALDLMGIYEGMLPDTHEENPVYVDKALRKGLPYKAYSHLSARRDLGSDSLLPILGISIATLKRRAKERVFNPAESNRLYRFSSLLPPKKLERVFSPRKAVKTQTTHFTRSGLLNTVIISTFSRTEIETNANSRAEKKLAILRFLGRILCFPPQAA